MSSLENLNQLYYQSIEQVLDFEGGWVNDKDDPGGETVAGICRKYWPSFSGWKIVDEAKDSKGIARISSQDLDIIRSRAKEEVYSHYRAFESEMQDKSENLYKTLLFFSVHAGVKNAKIIAKKANNLDEALLLIAEYYRRLFVQKPKMNKYRRNFSNRLSLFAGRRIEL